jgi:Asp-tRNA(Asn)/Glu-tRNA(Gln) amidotransferase B subunit
MNKSFKKHDPNDNYVNNIIKFYFYQQGKETYLISQFYYPIEIGYFDIPKGETLKTMIESGKIYMSKDEELIKNKLIEWKNLKQD